MFDRVKYPFSALRVSVGPIVFSLDWLVKSNFIVRYASLGP